MKDFENQITELKKENFNLKLRIYFLEERMQQEFDGPIEHICKTNIELKVEVESLKRELQEREKLLLKASKAVESLAEGGGSELQRVKEEAQRQVQQVEELLTQRIRLLEEDVKTSRAELEKALAGTETEMTLRMNLENQLAEMRQLCQDGLEKARAVEEKDRLIEELKLSLKSKEAIIQSLKEERSQVASPEENVASGELGGLSATLREEKERESKAAQHQEERQHLEAQIQALEEDLREKEREIVTEKKNSFKRDKAIQGLTVALKSKEKEVGELSSEIEELKAAFHGAREAAQKAEAEKLQGSEDYEAALSEKTALLTELQSENLSKNTENQKLRRSIKKVTQELCDLQQEKQRLEGDLEAALGEKSQGDAAIRDLKSEVEKLRHEAEEREKAAEKRYESLLSQSQQKLQDQERELRRLTENASQRSVLVQEKQQLDYEELLQVLKKELDIYTHLIKSLQDSGSLNNLQAELGSISALRKQLEADVLSYQNLKRTLEEQICEIRRREEESLSFYSDQTSYLSICLEEHNRFQVEHFSREELKKKVSDLIQLVKELYADNQHLKKTILDFSCLGFPGGEESTGRTELLASQEDEDTLRSGEDDEDHLPSDQNVEESSKGPQDHSGEHCQNGSFQLADSTIVDHEGGPGEQSLEERELLNLLGPFFSEKAAMFLESRPELLELLWELLLERMCVIEQEVLGQRSDSKTVKVLKQIATRLKDEPGHFIHADSFAEPYGACRLLCEGPRPKASEDAKPELKDASAQTVTMEGDAPCFREHEGRREPWEEKPPDVRCSAEHQPEHLQKMQGRQDAKKSRLPVPIKPSWSLGSVSQLPDTQAVEAQLQGQILELQAELKEFKLRNKQLHHQLILAEAMMEGRPAADQAPPNGKHPRNKLYAHQHMERCNCLLCQPSEGAAYQEHLGEQDAVTDVWTDLERDGAQQRYKNGLIYKEQLQNPNSKNSLIKDFVILLAPTPPLKPIWLRLWGLYSSRRKYSPQVSKAGMPGIQASPALVPGSDQVLSNVKRKMSPSREGLGAWFAGMGFLNKALFRVVKGTRCSDKISMWSWIVGTVLGAGKAGHHARFTQEDGLKDLETLQPKDLPLSLTTEPPSLDIPDPTSPSPSPDCTSQRTITARGPETHLQPEDTDASNDTAVLKRKISDLETENQVYRDFFSQLQKRSQCSEAIVTVLCGTEGAQDGAHQLSGRSTEEEEMTFPRLRQVHYVKHMKILHPLASEMTQDKMLESLQKQLVEQDSEPQKEQSLNVELLHHLPHKFRDLSPSRYDSLVQSQARELSLQRQQIKDGRGICVVCRQHMSTMIKAFQELLQASDVDYFVAEGFQEQLNRCAELLKKLETLFFGGKSAEVEMSPQNEELERVEGDNATYQHLLPDSSGPSVSHGLSDYDLSEKSSSSRDQKPDSETEKTSVGANILSQDLLMEHIQEIRSLRKRLEESIKTNEKLRRQLERQGSEPDQGAANVMAYGSELHSSLTSEIHFLRKQNQALNAMLARGSRDKQKENEKLRESLSRKTANFERLQQEYAWLKGERERLQGELAESERHNQQLLQEACHTRRELCRVQEEVELKQHLLSQNDKLLQALRVELKVYEKLDKEHGMPRDTRAEASGEGWRGQAPLADLPSLLAEIQALRAQLETSIETNRTLQSKLEEQLVPPPKENPQGPARPSPEPPQHLDEHDGDIDPGPMATDNSFDLFDSRMAMPSRSASDAPPLSCNDVDSISCDSGSSAISATYKSPSVPEGCPWASPDGRHVLGLLEDYDTLCKQIGQGQKLLVEMEMDSRIQEAPNPSGRDLGSTAPPPAATDPLVARMSTARLVLEKATKLLTLFWKVSLPANGRQCSLHCEQTGEMKAEITKLQKKLLEQEKKLQSTMKHLQLSKHQERVIFDQLLVTHKILRKARGNLELRPGGTHVGTPSPSRPGS
ncbi:CDK5 regulatory subunit-associated protein 2 [Suncus etruscus]|uniref:CDK5 regulatory subunit-associated protein 2 n=1 Tax=Suncus etruscus TaxID=109475 RepID=UPI00210FFD9B|nr:CDK5 regulatory subunit-associated protein 2 [Suncus etruscus]